MRISVGIAAILGYASALSIPQTPFLLESWRENSFIQSLNSQLSTKSSIVKNFWQQELAKNGAKIASAAEGVKGTPFETKTFDYIAENEAYPNHKIRFKTPDIQIDTVKQYTGYFDMEESDKHLFFWFFESRNDPKTDPIVLWLNGGPGCSSMMGLFFELGPASITPEIKPVRNNESWINNASMIFLDSPVNTGYSYSSQIVNNTFVVSHDVIAFLDLFFIKFPEYAKLPFHIAGESYGGHYVPKIAKDILDTKGLSFELQSILVGNGLTDMLVQYEYYQPMACGLGGYPAVVKEDQCEIMKATIPNCTELIAKCYDTEDAIDCYPATEICNDLQMVPYSDAGYNMYDVTLPCVEEGLCYEQINYYRDFLNSTEVREAVGAEIKEYNSCNMDTNWNFILAGDWMQSYFRDAIHDVVEAGLPVLIYAGDKDFICNWLGNQAWVDRLKWSGSDEWNKTEIKKWYNGDVHAGDAKNHKNLTFLRVFGAGHMVPFDQPENSLDFFNRWINGDREFT